MSTTVAVDTTGKIFVPAPPDKTAAFEPGEVVELIAALNPACETARTLRNCRRSRAAS
ncbi:hypothetical protein [Saccharopolyspora endophytica]|uniref:Uncharacterized protein n=1 Tax=Saccharopolyspora endophytica TaxID=543886 RepID=A0ABS5DQR2_9PSEU|nr:hypothetical protein [Saccharopolyspora endophytica]MBQ0928645.1 hypothetical protein [Saccharopolyspora endophytica]